MNDRRQAVRRSLEHRVKVTIVAAMLPGIAAISISPAGGPAAGLLDLALLGLALWLARGRPAQPPGSKSAAMTGNQALLLVLALSGAAVLIVAGAASRPSHGLAVAPFAMTAFALSSHHSRDLRSGVLAGVASLLVLSVADDRAVVIALCAVGLVPLVFSWVAVRQLFTLDQFPDAPPVLREPGRLRQLNRPWRFTVVARLVVLTAVLALLLPAEPAPHLHRGAAGGGGKSAAPLPGSRGSAIGNADGGLDLRERGSLDAVAVLDVPADSPTHWQGGYVDTYNGSGWSRQASGDRTPVQTQLPDGMVLRNDSGQTASQVRRLQSGQFLVYAPGPVLGVDAASGRLVDLGTGSLAVFDRANPLLTYEVDYSANGATSVGSLTGTLPPVTDKRWLTLPAALPSRVADLARTVTASATTTQDKVEAVETYLRANEKYSLDSPVPPEGKDAVDAFLFTDHVGFCEQFASAEAVMLRTLGIPSRVATGYGGDGAPSATTGRRVYRNEDAHAWVQVGLPGQRWVDSDPTAGSQPAPATAKHRLQAWLTHLWQRLTGTPAARRILAVVLLALSFALVLLAPLVRRVLQSRRPRRSRSAAPPDRAAPQPDTAAGQAYQRLLDRLAGQGRGRQPTETVRDVLFRLGAPGQELVAGVLEAQWYGRPGPPAARAAEAVAILDRLAAEPLVAAAP